MQTTIITLQIFFGTIIVFSILSLIGLFIKISYQNKKDLIEKMYKNGDINFDTYVKYLKEFINN